MTTMALEHWTTICRCGEEQVIVEPDAVIGYYAVHPAITHGTVKGPGYTVTHRASGYAVWHTRGFAEACAVARWLDEQKTLPEGAEEALRWKRELTPVARGRLVGQLSAIAPREYVVT